MSFKSAFVLSDIDGELPAGDYVVETTEEMIDGLSFTSYRRVSTTISLPGLNSFRGNHRTMSRQVVEIDPDELDRALLNDEMVQT